MKRYLLELCRVYQGEKDSLWDEDEDEFRWYIWNIESAIVGNCCDSDTIEKFKMQKIDEWKKYFNSRIQTALERYASRPFGDNPDKWLMKYKSLQ